MSNGSATKNEYSESTNSTNTPPNKAAGGSSNVNATDNEFLNKYENDKETNLTTLPTASFHGNVTENESLDNHTTQVVMVVSEGANEDNDDEGNVGASTNSSKEDETVGTNEDSSKEETDISNKDEAGIPEEDKSEEGSVVTPDEEATVSIPKVETGESVGEKDDDGETIEKVDTGSSGEEAVPVLISNNQGSNGGKEVGNSDKKSNTEPPLLSQKSVEPYYDDGDDDDEGSSSNGNSTQAEHEGNGSEISDDEANDDDITLDVSNEDSGEDDFTDPEKQIIKQQVIADEEKAAKKIGGWAILLCVASMMLTAYQMSENPDGVFASVCRLSLTMTGCIFKILLYPCKKLCGNRFNGYEHHLVTTQEFREGVWS